MSGDDAQELRDTTTRHDERIAVLEKCMEKQEPKLDSIIDTLAKLSSYNIEVAGGLRKAVYGNGKPGLISEVSSLAQSLITLKDNADERKVAHERDLESLRKFAAAELAEAKLQAATAISEAKKTSDKDIADAKLQAAKDIATSKESHDKDLARLERIMMWMGGTLVLTLLTILWDLVKTHLGGG